MYPPAYIVGRSTGSTRVGHRPRWMDGGYCRMPRQISPRGAEGPSAIGAKSVQGSLTGPLFDLLCRNPENRGNLHHDLDHRVHHFGSRRHLCVKRQTPGKVSSAPKPVDERFLAGTNLGCLGNMGVTMAREKGQGRIRTDRSTPTAQKPTIPGEGIECESTKIRRAHVLRHSQRIIAGSISIEAFYS